MSARNELHFYPGVRLLTFLRVDGPSRRVLARAQAAGGPPTSVPDPRMPQQPTTAGRYVIDRVEAYKTPTWPTSRIAWGTPLRDEPRLNDVFYQVRNGVWGSLKNDFNFARNDIRQAYFLMYHRLETPRTWVFNDFGPIGIRYFIDVDGDRRLGRGERLMGEMIHTTPKNEAQTASGETVALEESHGCIHVKPNDRDVLMRLGAFSRGMTFVVHPYSARYQ